MLGMVLNFFVSVRGNNKFLFPLSKMLWKSRIAIVWDG